MQDIQFQGHCGNKTEIMQRGEVLSTSVLCHAQKQLKHSLIVIIFQVIPGPGELQGLLVFGFAQHLFNPLKDSIPQ